MRSLLSRHTFRVGLLTIGVLFACLAQVQADVRVPNIFSNSMVLQRDQENRIWGRADAGEKVTVTIGDQKHEAAADSEGNWQVKLSPLSAGGPFDLVIKGSNEIKIGDVLVGEVWICSGQSNMQWNVNASKDADLERLAANYPQIRMINFPQVGAQEPIWSHDDRKWLVCTPENVGSFSAVGYFFARQLYDTIHVPIGMINNAWGGSACEAWIKRDLLAADPAYKPMLERWDAMLASHDALAAKDTPTEDEKKQLSGLKQQLAGNHNPANIYNGVLKSHLGYGIRGAIWYQGESNAGRAYQYRDLFPLMIKSWRDEWAQGDFPFYWVQLADFQAEVQQPGESAWAELREAQTMTMDKLANTGEAVIIDAGESYDIHPKNKQDVGKRLARWALAKQYGVDIAAQSPRFKSMEVAGNTANLTFDHVGSGWRPFDVRELRGFTIAGEDKKFVPAEAKILRDGRIAVSSDAVATPVAVRYGWADNPVVNVFTTEGLPLTPFRTDDWPGVTIDNK